MTSLKLDDAQIQKRSAAPRGKRSKLQINQPGEREQGATLKQNIALVGSRSLHASRTEPDRRSVDVLLVAYLARRACTSYIKSPARKVRIALERVNVQLCAMTTAATYGA